jgi:hypothetical protein
VVEIATSGDGDGDGEDTASIALRVGPGRIALGVRF